jgi:hypothetical protein
LHLKVIATETRPASTIPSTLSRPALATVIRHVLRIRGTSDKIHAMAKVHVLSLLNSGFHAVLSVRVHVMEGKLAAEI